MWKLILGAKNRILQLLARIAPGQRSVRVWLHRLRGVKIGADVWIGYDCIIETRTPERIAIGDRVSVGIRAIVIGHFRGSTKADRLEEQSVTVRIEDDVYLGPGVILLPNVTIGRGSVVNAGSVVTRSVPPMTMVQGNPARPVARCGIPLGVRTPWKEFLLQLKPLEKGGTPGE